MLIGVASSTVSLERGGDTTYLRELLSGLGRVDTANRYLLYDIQDHPFYQTLPRQFTLRPLPHPFAYNSLTSMPWSMWRDGVDLVHVLYVLPAWLRTPAVATIHDLHFEHYPTHYPRFDRWYLKLFVRWSAHRADRIITGSEFARRDIQARYGVPPGKIAVIPHGVSPRFRPVLDRDRLQAVRERYGITGPFLLFFGRLVDRRKNVRLLIDAFLDLDPGLAGSCQLVVAGANIGPLLPALMTDARQRSNGRIIFPGFVSDDDLPALISAAEVLVYPSIFEGFGLPVLEAMACGTAVATSNATSLPEVAGESALYFDPHDKQSLVRALERLLADAGLREHYRALGLQRAAAFTWEESARQTLAVYAAAQARRPLGPEGA